MPHPPFIAVICGLKSEAAVVRAAAPTGKVRVGVSGANAGRAEEIAARYCREGARAVLSIGVSGGLSPHLSTGDLVLGDVVRTKSGEEFFASRNLIASLETAGLTVAIQHAALFGSDAIVASAREKARLFERYGAVAVDMESHGAARAARAAGVPFAAVRAIADPASRALPPAASHAVTADGGTRVFSVLLECAKAPGQFPALLQLGADSNKALKSLRDSLGGLFDRLCFSLDL
jgi:hopanoid-associated phosphorylase